MEHLNEQELKEIIKEEIIRKVVAQQLDEQVFKKLMSWIKGKLPTVNQDQVEQAIEDHTEDLDDANIDQFIEMVNADVKKLLDSVLPRLVNQVIKKSVMAQFNKLQGQLKDGGSNE